MLGVYEGGRCVTWIILEQDFRIRCLKRSMVGSNHILPIHARSHRDRRPMHGSRVKPKLVCEVAFQEWTSDGKMRAPSFLGLRDDKDRRK